MCGKGCGARVDLPPKAPAESQWSQSTERGLERGRREEERRGRRRYLKIRRRRTRLPRAALLQAGPSPSADYSTRAPSSPRGRPRPRNRLNREAAPPSSARLLGPPPSASARSTLLRATGRSPSSSSATLRICSSSPFFLCSSPCRSSSAPSCTALL